MSPTASIDSDDPGRTRAAGRERRSRLSEWLVGGVVLGVAAAMVVVFLFTQTSWGRERALALTLNALSANVNGELVVERVAGNLLTGAKLYEVAVRTADGEPLLLADSAFVDYDLPTLLGGDILLSGLVLYDPEVYLRKLPGDTLWNYQQLFPPGEEGGGPGRAIMFEDVRVVSGLVVVRMEWEPDQRLDGDERERAIAGALADTSRLMVERVSGGLLRTMRFGLGDARLSNSVYAPEERGGSFFQVDHASGFLQLWREILPVRDVQGEVALEEGRLEVRASPVILPDSRLSAYGVVRFPDEEAPDDEENRYDITIEGEDLAFSDLEALYPHLPEDGRARLRLTFESRPEGTLFLVRQLRLQAPGTEIVGDFGLVTGDTLRFLDAELTAPRLSVPTVEAMLPENLPVEGLRIGEAEIRNPRA